MKFSNGTIATAEDEHVSSIDDSSTESCSYFDYGNDSCYLKSISTRPIRNQVIISHGAVVSDFLENKHESNDSDSSTKEQIPLENNIFPTWEDLVPAISDHYSPQLLSQQQPHTRQEDRSIELRTSLCRDNRNCKSDDIVVRCEVISKSDMQSSMSSFSSSMRFQSDVISLETTIDDMNGYFYTFKNSENDTSSGSNGVLDVDESMGKIDIFELDLSKHALDLDIIPLNDADYELLNHDSDEFLKVT